MTGSQGTTTSAARAADVLLLFTDESDTLGVSHIARELGLSKAVVHRILTTFVSKGMLIVTRPAGEYRLGPAVVTLGARAMRASSLRSHAQPLLEGIQAQTGETATVSALVGQYRTYLAQVESPSEIKMTVEIGRRFPLHTGSSGRCILAFQRPALIESTLGGTLQALTGESLTDPVALADHLEKIRRAGWSSSAGERMEGAASVAAPVFNMDGYAIGAISVCGPAHRMTAAANTHHAKAVVAAADEVSRALGWRGGLPDPAERTP